MLTYDLNSMKGNLYENLYSCIREDIINGRIKQGEKMPSKRTLAENLGVSSLTVENAYLRLMDEGLLYSEPKRGYFVSNMAAVPVMAESKIIDLNINTKGGKKDNAVSFDFSSNRTETGMFPFSVWAKLMREVISNREEDLLKVSPTGGVYELKEAIAEHLSSFRGMAIDPDQIIVGAGTEYIYTMITKLLGKDKVYGIENPGYQKINRIYRSENVDIELLDLDNSGIDIGKLRKSEASIVHVSPIHQFPTGITMTYQRKQELLNWAYEKEGRYIIEDEYDSEFRLNKKPIPPLMSSDSKGRVIYINTFSKSLTSTIRISYMILPKNLAELFYEKLFFYSNTVSTFEQYILSEFIKRGYFEKHINRMRLHYIRKKKEIENTISEVFEENQCKIIENDSGLHFILELNTKLPDEIVEEELLKRGIRLNSISSFDIKEQKKNYHRFLLNFSGMQTEGLKNSLKIVKEVTIKK